MFPEKHISFYSISCPVGADEFGAGGGDGLHGGAQAGGGFGEGFELGGEGLFEDGAVFGFGGAAGALLEGLDQPVVQTADDELAHGRHRVLSINDSRAEVRAPAYRRRSRGSGQSPGFLN